jgi:hypothetical protein
MVEFEINRIGNAVPVPSQVEGGGNVVEPPLPGEMGGPNGSRGRT